MIIDYHFKTACCAKPAIVELYRDVPLRFEITCPYECNPGFYVKYTYKDWKPEPHKPGRGRNVENLPARLIPRVPGTLVPSIASALGHGVSRRSRCSHLYPKVTSVSGDRVCANCGSK